MLNSTTGILVSLNHFRSAIKLTFIGTQPIGPASQILNRGRGRPKGSKNREKIDNNATLNERREQREVETQTTSHAYSFTNDAGKPREVGYQMIGNDATYATYLNDTAGKQNVENQKTNYADLVTDNRESRESGYQKIGDDATYLNNTAGKPREVEEHPDQAPQVSAKYLEVVDLDEDGDEKAYCFCRSVGQGDMIACDTPTCPYEWFHWRCVGLQSAPLGTWLCPVCIGIRKFNRSKKSKKKIK